MKTAASFSLVLCFALTSQTAAQQKVFLGKTAGQWSDALAAGDAKTRGSAAFALGKLGQSAQAHMPSLVKILKSDNDPAVRQASAFAIGEICKSSPSAKKTAGLLPALREKLLLDADARVRRSSAFALGCIRHESALADLSRAAREKSPAVRQNAVWALGEFGPRGYCGVRLALVSDTDPQVLRDAAIAMGKCGAQDAAAALSKLALHRDVEVKKAALASLTPVLQRTHAPLAAANLRKALGDAVPEIRRNAALALGNIGGEAAAPAVPILLHSLKSGEATHKRQAAAVLGNVGPSARAAVPALRKSLQSADAVLRRNAVSALGGIKSELAAVVPELVGILRDSKEKAIVREEAGFALLQIGKPPKDRKNEKEMNLWRNRLEVLEKEIPKVINVIADRKQPAEVRIAALMSLHAHGGTLEEHESVMKTLDTIVASEPKKKSRKMLRYDSAFLLAMLLGDEVKGNVMTTLQEFLEDKNVLIHYDASRMTNIDVEKKIGKSKLGQVGRGDGRVMCVQALRNVGADTVGNYPGIVRQLRFLLRDKDTNKKLRQDIVALFKQFKWKN